jgi:hypothetical protein
MAEEVDPATKLADFLATARKRFAAAAEDEKHLRDSFISDLKFASPDGAGQWDEQVKQQRQNAGRPAMSFPRCHTFVQQVSNEARQNKPQIKFAPRLDSDAETAEVYEGLARFIQYESDAQIAYETAVEYSAGGSFGYYRFLTDYVDDESDDLELKVVPVLDPLTIFGILVPNCFNRQPKFGFVIEDIPKEEYKAQYPDSEMASLSWAEAEKQGEGWVGSEAVRIAEYWWCDEKREKGQRKPKCTVRTCKINGMEILPGDDGESSETEWPGSVIPIIPVLGKQMIMEGKPKLFSVVSPQKSAQQLINYSKSRIAETLSTAPISPFLVVEGQISGYEEQWKTANTTMRPFLTYKSVDVAGRPAPAPERQTFEPPIQSLSSFVAQEIDDMKATSGIFDASLGNQANETSGKAIFARQQQSNLSTMHFMDNLERSFRKGGDVIAECIPKIYNTARMIRILGPDETPKNVQINQEHTDEKGKPQMFDLTAGKFDVVVTMGRAFATKRMESFDMYQSLVQAAPNLLPTFGDVMFKNSDTAGADIVSERFKKMLPPNLQGDDDDQPVPPQAQAQIQQLTQHLQAINAAAGEYEKQIQQLTFEKQAKVVEQQGRMAQIQAKAIADMALEDKKLLTAVTVAEINTKAQNAADREADRRELEAQFHAQAHEAGMQAQQAVAQQQQAQQQQDLQSQQPDVESSQQSQEQQ